MTTEVITEQGPPPIVGEVPNLAHHLLRGARQLAPSVEIEVQRATAEVVSSVLAAQMTPRNIMQIKRDVLAACADSDLASQAFWEYQRGGNNLSGVSIRLAEELALHYGHLEWGFILHPRHDPAATETTVEAFCWDKQKNNRKVIRWSVEHKRYYSNAPAKILNDPRDVWETIASSAQRRTRDCILAAMPRAVVQPAINACRATLERISTNVGAAMADAVAQFAVHFGITQDVIEQSIGHSVALASEEDVIALHTIFTRLMEGESKAEDVFPWLLQGTAPVFTNSQTAPAAAVPASSAPQPQAAIAQTPQEQGAAPTATDTSAKPGAKQAPSPIQGRKLGGIKRKGEQQPPQPQQEQEQEQQSSAAADEKTNTTAQERSAQSEESPAEPADHSSTSTKPVRTDGRPF